MQYMYGIDLQRDRTTTVSGLTTPSPFDSTPPLLTPPPTEPASKKPRVDNSTRGGAFAGNRQPGSKCWFCLAEPDTETHLIVSVATETYLGTYMHVSYNV